MLTMLSAFHAGSNLELVRPVGKVEAPKADKFCPFVTDREFAESSAPTY
jgi:hypothetical protein